MIFRLTAFLLLSFLFVMSGNNAFASKPIPPHACGGYNEKGDVCTATCKEGESATCINPNGDQTPNCSCEAGKSEQSLNDFLKSLKAKLENEDMFQRNIGSVQFIGDVTLEVDPIFSPDGKLALATAAICHAIPYTTPPSTLCELKIADPLQQKITLEIP